MRIAPRRGDGDTRRFLPADRSACPFNGGLPAAVLPPAQLRTSMLARHSRRILTQNRAFVRFEGRRFWRPRGNACFDIRQLVYSKMTKPGRPARLKGAPCGWIRRASKAAAALMSQPRHQYPPWSQGRDPRPELLQQLREHGFLVGEEADRVLCLPAPNYPQLYDADTLCSVLGTPTPAASGAKVDRDGCVFPAPKNPAPIQFGSRGTSHRPRARRTWALVTRLGRVAVLRRDSPQRRDILSQ